MTAGVSLFSDPMTLVLTVVFIALVFEYINGFHDTANSIATVVSTRVLTPRMAIMLAAFTNLWGALYGTAVAKTIAGGLVDSAFVSTAVIVCALLGGIVWNLLTWWFGLPSSSSHALVGGLCGATLGAAVGSPKLAGHSVWTSLIWSQPKPGAPLKDWGGLLYKVVIPMITSPVLGLVIGFLMMTLLYACFGRMKPRAVSQVFGKLQLVSAGYMGWAHGSNDAQKTMGVICLALVAATKQGVFQHGPQWVQFMATADGGKNQVIPLWIKVSCALVMAAGTAAGGWRIIRTMGHKMVKLLPIHGFAAETTAATVISVAGQFGMPVSTTHAISASIMGVGAAKRLSALNLHVISRILVAWVLTLPCCMALGFGAIRLWLWLGWPPQ